MSFEKKVYNQIDANNKRRQEVENARAQQQRAIKQKQIERNEVLLRNAERVQTAAIAMRNFLIQVGAPSVALPGIKKIKVEKFIPRQNYILNIIGLTIDAYKEGADPEIKPKGRFVTQEINQIEYGWTLTTNYHRRTESTSSSFGMDGCDTEYSDGTSGIALTTNAELVHYREGSRNNSENRLDIISPLSFFSLELPDPEAWHRLFVRTAVNLSPES